MPTIGHAELPYPRGTLVEDSVSERTGYLMGVIEKRNKDGRLIGRQAYMRPKGGGLEWDVPLDRIRPVETRS